MRRPKQLGTTATRSKHIGEVILAARLVQKHFDLWRRLGLVLIMLCMFGLAHLAAFAQIPAAPTLTPLTDPATPEQIRQYFKVSGELDAYRARWIAALDKNHSIGEPYWPEAFWTETKSRMKDADLTPMFTMWFQHTVSRELMQQVLDTYQRLSAKHFQGSPACFKLGEAQEPYKSELDKLTLANTSAVITEVYTVYKPQIKAARARYIAQHPDWKDK